MIGSFTLLRSRLSQLLLSAAFTMGLAATIYAELLSQYGYGRPLWNPEPRKGLDGVVRDPQLGDVGYFDKHGGFRRLFNITVDRNHELNAGGVPDEFKQIRFSDTLICEQEQALHPGPLCSEGVKSREVKAELSG